MTNRHVGYYVHHHGRGHLQRALTISRHLDRVTFFSSLDVEAITALPPHCDLVRLPLDDASNGQQPRTVDAHGALHWAPLRHRGYSRRQSMMAEWMADHDPAAFVVDTSVEVLTLARIMGSPSVLSAMPGVRTDAPHQLAYSLADAIIAPWPSGVHPRGSGLDAFSSKLYEVGGVSRFGGEVGQRWDPEGPVVVLGGAGGSSITPTHIADLREQSSNDVVALGVPGSQWVDDPQQLLRSASVVICAAGQNSVADVAACGSRAIVIAQDRPFGEQHATAAALRALDVAVVVDRWPHDWHSTLERARALKPDWSLWQTKGAAERAAAVINDAADGVISE